MEEEIQTKTIELQVSNETYNHQQSKNFLIKGSNVELQLEQYNEKQVQDFFDQKIKNQKENVQEEIINKCLQDIRWKLNENQEVETNCKLVEWEDGSYSLFIGDKQYEYIISNQQNTKLFTNHHSDALISQQDIKLKAVHKSNISNV